MYNPPPLIICHCLHTKANGQHSVTAELFYLIPACCIVGEQETKATQREKEETSFSPLRVPQQPLHVSSNFSPWRWLTDGISLSITQSSSIPSVTLAKTHDWLHSPPLTFTHNHKPTIQHRCTVMCLAPTRASFTLRWNIALTCMSIPPSALAY